MKNHEWSGIEVTKRPIGVGEGAPIKYGIPYSWGALHVTQQADEAYSLTPLVPGVTKEAIEPVKCTEQGLRADVFVLSPQEFNDYTGTRDGDTTSTTFRGHATMHSYGTEVRLALNEDKSKLREAMLGDLAMVSSMLDIDIDTLKLDNDIPATESIEPTLSQIIVHAMADFAGDTVREAAHIHLMKKLDEQAVKSATIVGAGAILGSGAISGIDLANNGSVDAITAGFAAGFTGIYLYSAQRSLKRYMRHRAAHEAPAKLLSSIVGVQVGQDIHNAFCTTHFDHNAEAMLKD